MKKLLLFAGFTLLFSTSSLFAQATDSIEVNSLKAVMHAGGGLEQVSVLDAGVYKNLIYTQNLWFAALDASASLRTSVQTYRQSPPDFNPGPISNDPNVYTRYDKVYHVKLQTISDFVNGLTAGVPPEIAHWPAHGNTAFGEAANLAPFVDVNQDGQYDPTQGDYPDIKGDEALFTLFNETNHRPTEGMGLEIHLMIYGYYTGGIEDSILYMDYTVFNRSNQAYSQAYVSSFMDFDLGNPDDDLPGTNVSGDAVFCYNSANIDSGPAGFGNQPASCGIRILKGPPADFFDGVDNDKDGCVDGVRINGACQSENPAQGIREHYKMSGSMMYTRYGSGGVPNVSDPSTPDEYYQYMKGLWRNGNPLVIETPSGFGNVNNGDGYTNSGSGTPIDFAYPGNSFDTSFAYVPSADVNWFASPSGSADFRALANMGPFTLAPGASFDLKMAIVWSRDSSTLAGYTNLNHRLANLNKDQPVRYISHRASPANHQYDVVFNSANQRWAVHNRLGTTLHFRLVSLSGQTIDHFRVGPHEKLNLDRSGYAPGIYLLMNESGGKAHKITY